MKCDVSVKIQRCVWRLRRLRPAVCRPYAVRCALVCPSVAVITPTQRSKSSQRDAQRRRWVTSVSSTTSSEQRNAWPTTARCEQPCTAPVQCSPHTPRRAPPHDCTLALGTLLSDQLLTQSPPLDTHCTGPVLAFLTAHTSRRLVDARSYRKRRSLALHSQHISLCWSQRIHKSGPCSLQSGINGHSRGTFPLIGMWDPL